MNNYVKVQPATPAHPEGVVELWVKDKHAVLTPEEASEVITALQAFAAIETPPPVEEPTPEPPPAEPEPDEARVYRGRRGR